MPLSSLPNELIEEVTDELLTYPDVASFARISRHFYAVLNIYLYHRSYKESNASRQEYNGLEQESDGSEHDALTWASRHGRMVTLLRAEALGIPIRAPSLLAVAAENGHMDMVKYLLPRMHREDLEPQDNALVKAYKNGHFDVFRFLVDHSADLDALDDEDMTALHFAASAGDIPSMKLLLDRGAKVDVLDTFYRYTPLHYACEAGNFGAVELLLARDADCMAETFRLHTPMHCAAWSGCLGAVKLLVEKGADYNEVDGHGWTPQVVAIESKCEGSDAVARYLVELEESAAGPNA